MANGESGEGRKVPRRAVGAFVVLVVGITAYVGYARYSATRPYEWSGTIEARTIEVGSRTGGRVKEVLVKEGDRIEAGATLVVLEPGDLEARRMMAAAELDQAIATLDKLKSGARPEEIEQAKARSGAAAAALAEARHGARPEEIRAARARLESAKAVETKAKTDAERTRALTGAGAVSRAELDAAEASLRSATASREVAEEQLKELEKGVRPEQIAQASSRAEEAAAGAKLVEAGARVEDLRAAEAQALAAKGQLALIETSIAELRIVAPVASRIETLDLRPGDILPPNATAAVLLEDDQLYVRMYVPETQIGLVHPGDEVPVFVDSFPGVAFRAQVQHVDMQGQYSPRNLQTADERANQVFASRVDLIDGKDKLRAGMAAIVKVPRGAP